MADVIMPQLGDGMEAGKLLTWHKKEGDEVREGEALFEVETDKSNVEVEAEASGVLAQVVVKEGETVPIKTVIAVITTGADGTARRKSAAPRLEATSTPEPAALEPAPAGSQAPHRAPREADHGHRAKASPLARRLARESGVDLSVIRGTGPHGRIVKRDLAEADAQAQHGAAEPPPAPISATASGLPARPSRIREAIARKTVETIQTVPHFYATMVIEMDRAQDLLVQLNASEESRFTVTDLLVKACAVALGAVPEVNSAWQPDGTVRRYAEAHIGVVVGMDDGLLIPVVRDCRAKSLRQISLDTRRLISRARNSQLTPDEYSGGTFTISNLGMMGIDEFTAIINQPEAAILAVGAITRTPVAGGAGDAIVLKALMKVTLSSDHRVLDGVLSARFLQELKHVLEAPYRLLV